MLNWEKRGKVAQSILETIGFTPLVKLNRVSKEINANILVKVEWFSPTGSHKDRIYYHMVMEAIRRGDLRPGMEILESSTGNAGTAAALVGAVLGYPVTIILPEGMSAERYKLMEMYGAKMIITPGAESDVDLCLKKQEEMAKEHPEKYWIPDQYGNPDNIEAHYLTTGREIWEQAEGKIDAVVCLQGSGATITGVGRYLREKNPKVLLYAGEPTEAPFLSEGKWGAHRIEGIGDGFIPRDLDMDLIDGVFLVSSEEAIEMGRRLAKEEGLFCGITSGGNVAGAIKVAKRHPELQVIVTVLHDTGQRYFSTPLCGIEKELIIPEREHPLMIAGAGLNSRDILRPCAITELEKQQARWEVIK